ncbi:RNA polymerase RpoN-/SigL-like sigma 54 subunit [Tepidamorphus gemmatus]|uniref:RNA polymerase sigma-54 factor n=1 Tax=Tepidamorphus gemmatus TaxID=747076 RepID=A0A4R3MER3_9HYPH|nr:RNA polymerase factor sigma-54 [Tepidamorphus gemmatus]TCT10697.1 RNA polymerase RpoN-/SigL-like sigma 54 subunit [Tepidamorphus gemmatus]
MALSPKLDLRQTQSLVMTPQLMQAIKLLQLSSMDVAAYVEAELERNPLLERADDSHGDAADAGIIAETDGDDGPSADAGPVDLVEAAGRGDAEAISESLDADFGNVFDSEPVSVPAGPVAAEPAADSGWAGVRGDRRSGDGEGDFLETAISGEIGLHDHLLAQLGMARLDPVGRMIGRCLIDLVDEAGYLTEPLDAVAARLGVDIAEVEQVLSVVQGFDPSGVCARNLAECLAIQLRERDRFDPAMQMLVANLELVARRELVQLRRLCGVDEEDLLDMIAELRRLDPRPGWRFAAEPVQPVVPDVFVRPRSDGGWHVEVNSDLLPKVLIDQSYYATVSRAARTDGERTYLSECLQQANWLVRSLDQRARTILKVATEIVRQQDAFLAEGVRFLRPLNLRTVADAIQMHESTVSRVTANKYLSTPRGIFEFKYFFTNAIAATEGGEAHSAEAVRHRIKDLIDQESPDNVLSDDTIVKLLREEGVDIARRTVAKYRESLRIPSSVERRRAKRVRL